MPEPRADGVERPTLIDVSDASGALPRAIAPMRPRLARDAFNSTEWLFELKWDGIRAVALAGDDGAVRLLDRHGGDLLGIVPELREIRLPPGTVLDGEVVVCDARGRPSFDLLAARAGPKALRRGRGPYFVAFDLLYDGGRPILGRPLDERRARLQAGAFGGRRVLIPDHLETDGEPFLEVVAEYGLEGIVAKRRDSRYVPGALSADWLKCHVVPRSDVVVGALIVDGGQRAREILCGVVRDDGSLAYAGSALVPPHLGAWLDRSTRDLATDVSPFAAPIPLRDGLRWLRPKLVAIVEHEGADDGALEGARFAALRFDAKAEECRREEAVSLPSGAPSGRHERPRLVLLQSLPFPDG